MSYNGVGSDYTNAEQHFHVSHPVGEALSTTSEIICFIGLLGVDKMWNDAILPITYLVAVDDSKCDSSSSQPAQGAASGGSSGSSAAVSLDMVTVRLSRSAAHFPRVEIWFDESDGPGGNPMEIRASVDVTAEPNSTNPYGAFGLSFAMMSGTTKAGFGNLITSAKAGSGMAFTFFEQFSESGQTARKGASVEMNADGSNLRAAVESDSPWDANSAWVVATGATSVLANNKNSGASAATSVSDVDLSTGVCVNKDNFKYRIHGYGLYNEADGSKKELNTGVSCEYTDGQAKTRNCHIGRHGAWFDRESDGTEHAFSDGDTVTQRAWGSNSANDGRTLTLSVSPGRLMKFTVKTYTLAEIEGMDFRMWDNEANGGQGQEYIVQYRTDIAAAGFYRVASMTWSQNGPPSKTDISSPVIITAYNNNTGNAINTGSWVWLWSDSLGGVTYIWDDPTIVARAEELITPAHADLASDLELNCLSRCPDPGASGISQAKLTNWGEGTANDPYAANPTLVSNALKYVVDSTTGLVYQGTVVGTNQVKLATGVTFSDNTSVYNWGFESGALVNNADAAAMVIADDTNLWAIYDTAGNSFYQYRMGPNSWDQTVMVKAGATYLSFDEPIGFDYTHTTANDRNGDSTYNGKKFYLRYHGEGHLEGFPWDQVDRDGDGTTDMWFPTISLVDGVQLTDGASNQYRLKAMYGDLTLTSAGADCSALSLALPAAAVPTTSAKDPSNISTDRPDHGTCEYISETESASGC